MKNSIFRVLASVLNQSRSYFIGLREIRYSSQEVLSSFSLLYEVSFNVDAIISTLYNNGILK